LHLSERERPVVPLFLDAPRAGAVGCGLQRAGAANLNSEH
jgi:hypothetical protein